MFLNFSENRLSHTLIAKITAVLIVVGLMALSFGLVKYFQHKEHLSSALTTSSQSLPKQSVKGEKITNFRLVISKLGINVPVIANVNGADKKSYFKALENGVAQLKGSALPDEDGNIFIFGHSSFYASSPGHYKTVFSHLDNLAVEDKITVLFNNLTYNYRVVKIQTVLPSAVNYAKNSYRPQLTLMTCVPPGTAKYRLIVIAEPTKKNP